MEDLLNFTFVANLGLSIFNVVLYLIGYTKVIRAHVNRNLLFTKGVILFELLAVALFALLQVLIYTTVVFLNDHTTEAIYLENVAILFFNIAFTANAALLAMLVEKKF